MSVHCVRCGAAVPDAEIDRTLMLAHCARCDHVMELGFTIRDAVPASEVPAALPLTPPSSVQVDDTGANLVITHRWFRLQHVLMGAFALFWNGFLVVWYAIALADGAWMALLFPLIHVAVGVGLAYTAITGFVNRTEVRVGAGLLQVRHEPLPWPGNRVLHTEDIAQLWCEEHVHRTKNGTTRTYSVEAQLRSGSGVRVLSGLASHADARFFEKRIERYLGIVDRPVPGEVAPPAAHG